jgi:acyl dehydratase
VDLPDSLTIVTSVVRPAMIEAYARLTRDYNPIHLDPAFAARTPFGRPIAHGTLSLNLLVQAATQTFGAAAMRGAEFNVRFLRPVFADDVLTASGVRQSAGSQDYAIMVANADGDAVINGILRLAGS